MIDLCFSKLFTRWLLPKHSGHPLPSLVYLWGQRADYIWLGSLQANWKFDPVNNCTSLRIHVPGISRLTSIAAGGRLVSSQWVVICENGLIPSVPIDGRMASNSVSNTTDFGGCSNTINDLSSNRTGWNTFLSRSRCPFFLRHNVVSIGAITIEGKPAPAWVNT